MATTAHPQQLRLESLAIDDTMDAGAAPRQPPKTPNEWLVGDGWLQQIAWAGADEPQPPRFGQVRLDH